MPHIEVDSGVRLMRKGKKLCKLAQPKMIATASFLWHFRRPASLLAANAKLSQHITELQMKKLIVGVVMTFALAGSGFAQQQGKGAVAKGAAGGGISTAAAVAAAVAAAAIVAAGSSSSNDSVPGTTGSTGT